MYLQYKWVFIIFIPVSHIKKKNKIGLFSSSQDISQWAYLIFARHPVYISMYNSDLKGKKLIRIMYFSSFRYIYIYVISSITQIHFKGQGKCLRCRGFRVIKTWLIYTIMYNVHHYTLIVLLSLCRGPVEIYSTVT